MSFNDSLLIGKTSESRIAKWLNKRGHNVLPVYELSEQKFKGPQLFTPDSQIIVPDMFVFKGDKAIWVEAKHKSAFTWHRITSRWTTGIDIRVYKEYLKIAEQTPFPVWLLFLQLGGQAKDSPADSPTGLFGNELSYLSKYPNHEHENGGKGGMVYWTIEDTEKNIKGLVKLAELTEL